jgi:FKBP-type peptidyl-prolyl cis-trans isomerase
MRSAFACLTLVVLLAACNTDKEGFSRTKNGLLYKVIESGKGEVTASAGDLLVMDIEYKNSKDSVLFDSRLKSDSFAVKMVPPTFVGGIEEGFAMMHEGDIWQFKVPADSVFLRTFFHQTLPPYVEKGSYLRFQVKLKRIIPKAIVDSLSSQEDIRLRRAEFSKIEAFLKRENMDVMPTQNGAYIKTIRSGNGNFPHTGDTVVVNYTGRTIDGRIFAEVTAETGSLHFAVGKGMVLSGWDEVMPYLDEGSVSRVLLPSDLAYGAAGKEPIPGYTSVIYDIELVKIIRRSEN